MSKHESTTYLGTLFDNQYCHYVSSKLVYSYMCRFDYYVNYIWKDILATSFIQDRP